MPAVKTEKSNPRLPTSNRLDSSPTPQSRGYYSYYMRPHGPPAHARNNSPHRGTGDGPQPRQGQGPEAPAAQQEPMYTHAAVVQAIACASHDTLLRAGNMAYQTALNEVAEKRTAAEHYFQKIVELFTELDAARNAYTQVLAHQRDHVCRVEGQRIQQAQAVTAVASGTSVSIPAPAAKGGTTSGDDLPPPCPIQTPQVYSCGPVAQPGGFRLVTGTSHRYKTFEERPSDLPPQVFWNKSEWSGKDASFVTDRQGKHLRFLLKGIRRTARRIWTEIDITPGRCTGKTFLKNESAFIDDYVGTIEEIYPCLKLCSGHWKALQIGTRSYPHWYRRRSMTKALEATSG